MIKILLVLHIAILLVSLSGCKKKNKEEMLSENPEALQIYKDAKKNKRIKNPKKDNQPSDYIRELKKK